MRTDPLKTKQFRLFPLLQIFTIMNKNSTAYIDASNLKFGVAQSGWKFDYKSFRSWLRDKFGVSRATLFMGLIIEKLRQE